METRVPAHDDRLPAQGGIFDLDGVLVDTARFHFAGWQMTAERLGFELADADEELLKGVSRNEALEIVLEKGGVAVAPSERARLADEKNAWFVAQIQQLTQAALLPGALDLLESLRRLNIPLALASSSRNAPVIVERVGVARFFDAVVDPAELSATKPDPEIFVRAAEGLGLSPGSCIVFEDAPAGIRGALRAGCVAVGVGDAAVLHEADIVVKSLLDVPVTTLFTHQR
jgi:beta-phosphoglucomutase